ncbi:MULTISPECIES: hypothetical protein [Vibrio]|uniref:hypothetical protein n=1 Tax=Vibrio TaxID=662 RepID=UPI001CDCB0B7|nr:MULTISPECIES: hypothetical protein [Vibrio]EGR1219824.1 hypothetical protein [Vibrio parahaemolyticus]MCA2438593.1 hypothetical protein [Vibrio alginolyticus]MCS0082290.1 hypothetical protein [Vibrio alginolyticus]MDW1729466.1 hypothetical protein [Vibrio sp. Vb2356]MDW1931188.1 hypothetical protein [Vibrio sp. 970]
MDAKQLTELVVRPTLKQLGLYSTSAEQLVVGTIFVESRGKYLKQIGKGPALGIVQMEPATHDDIWQNYLAYRAELKEKVSLLVKEGTAQELITNLAYAVAMCRVHYLRVPKSLPSPGDIPALARYWKTYYNTHKGAGEVSDFIDKFPKDILN